MNNTLMFMRTIQLPFDISLSPVKPLKAGPLSLDYDSGDLRSVKWRGSEIIRRIYFAVRNDSWETADMSLVDEQVTESADGFHIAYKARFSYQGREVYEADVILHGDDSEISFHVKGNALQAFSRNRIGICVHQPISECVGKSATITRADASKYTADFPQLISPHQPFKDIQEMTWCPGQSEAQLIFEGDIFESEDQRNWGDACFKTYSTPLDIPFPVQLQPGDTIEQKVTLKVKQTGTEQPAATSHVKTEWPLPAIGYSVAYFGDAITDKEVESLKKLPLEGYRCELRLTDVNWSEKLNEYSNEASRLNVALDLVVFFGDGSALETAQLIEALQRAEVKIASLLVLQVDHAVTPKSLINSFYPIMKARFPDLKIGFGTDAYFTEVNRQRPDDGTSFDFISFHVHPQVHATDTRSIMENVEALPWIVKTARSFAQGRPIYVSPLTFSKRSNPDAANTKGVVHEPVDERQHTAFAARFTVLALMGLAGADKVFLYKTVGEKGVVNESSTHLIDLLAKLKDFQPTSVEQPSVITWKEQVVFTNSKGEKLAYTS